MVLLTRVQLGGGRLHAASFRKAPAARPQHLAKAAATVLLGFVYFIYLLYL